MLMDLYTMPRKDEPHFKKKNKQQKLTDYMLSFYDYLLVIAII